MLSSIRVKNFKCLAQAELQFIYDQKKAPNGFAQMSTHPFILSAGQRLVPCMALYGANASGKTTVLQAVSTLLNFALNRIPPLSFFQPYLFKRQAQESTSIEMSWTSEEKLFTYGVEVKADQIATEELRVHDEILFSVKNGEIFFQQRDGSESAIKGLRIQCIDASSRRQLRPLLPAIARDYPGLDENINAAFSDLSTKFFYLDESIPAFQGIQNLASTFDMSSLVEREKAALDLISSFLRKLDVRIHRIEMRKTPMPISSLPLSMQALLLSQKNISPVQDNPDLTVNQIDFRTFHLSETGEEIPLKLSDESLGTQKLFGLLAFLLTALRKGGVAIIAEIDDSLHSMLLPELIKLFQLRDYNNQKAQLFFTIHNTDILASDQMTVSEVSFVSHNGFNGATIRRLSSFEGVRNVNNFRKQYLMGFYDAVPSPYI